jgi:MarR family 2-MHQ and catechol resistance regulon transcriptional repressor
MKSSTPSSTPPFDQRENHYLNRMRHHSERFPEFDWPSVELVINLIYTYEVVNASITRKIEKHGISQGAFNVMMILSRCEGETCQMSQLGELLLVSRANITGLVDCLVAKGYVQRLEQPRDRRVRLVHMTDEGHTFLDSILPAHYTRIRTLFSELSEKDKGALSASLTKLRHVVQDAQEPAEQILEG